MAQEIWLVDKEYPTHEISSFGRVRNVEDGNILDGSKQGNNYAFSISLGNGKGKHLKIHQRVAACFLPNPDGKKTQVIHKDRDYTNNHVDNLVWCDPKEAAAYIEHNPKKQAVHKMKNGEIIATYESVAEAALKNGLKAPNLGRACRESGPDKEYHEFHWEYVEERYTDEELDDLPSEIWKPYKETGYIVSNMGRVRNKLGKPVNPQKDQHGYLSAGIRLEKNKPLKILMHRMVAEAFIPNQDPQTLTVVGHKDNDRLNNKLGNLQWMSIKDKSVAIPVNQFGLDGTFIKKWSSASEASNSLGSGKGNGGHIGDACKGKISSAHGFQWKVADETIETPESIEPYRNPKVKYVDQFSPSGTHLVKRWSSAAEAARDTTYTEGTIKTACRSKKTKLVDGFLWSYAN